MEYAHSWYVGESLAASLQERLQRWPTRSLLKQAIKTASRQKFPALIAHLSNPRSSSELGHFPQCFTSSSGDLSAGDVGIPKNAWVPTWDREMQDSRVLWKTWSVRLDE